MSEKEDANNKTTQEKVFDACDALKEAGEKVSVRAAQKLVPTIKSVSTAHQYVVQWKNNEQKKKQSLTEGIEISQELIDAIANDFVRFIESTQKKYMKLLGESENDVALAYQAQEEAENREQDTAKALQDANEELDKKRDAEIAIRSKFEAELEAKTERIQELQSQANEWAGKYDALLQTNDKLKLDAALAAQISDSSVLTLSEVKAELIELKGEHKELADSAATLNTDNALKVAELERNKNETEILSKKGELIQKENNKLSADIGSLKDKVAGLDRVNEDLASKLTKAQIQRESEKEIAKDQDSEIRSLRNALIKLQEEIIKLGG